MKKRIAITTGDPAGIGPEIVIKALRDFPDLYDMAVPIIYGHRDILQAAAEAMNTTVSFLPEQQATDISALQPGQLLCRSMTPCPAVPPAGQICAQAGRLAFQYIESAISDALDHKIDAIATAPINKEALRLAGVPYLDHTEILTRLTSSAHTMTLFVTGSLRIFFLTRHLAFRDIAAHINERAVGRAIEQSIIHLKTLGLSEPKLALAALNPHGGENGMFGREEIDILQPAVERARANDLNVSGPVPADSVFHLAKEGLFDAVLSLYHDQGHIAAKTYDFQRTISLTMGLPFLRTSVDHGTAMDLAGKNRANAVSMYEAIKAAAKYAW